MELYEQNYMLLRLLVPQLKDGLPDTVVSSVPGCISLYMQVTEQNRYTSTIRLTYRFAGDTRASVEPDFLVRIYHDARTAEAVGGLLHGQRHIERKVRCLDGSWKLNRFLYKWLRYLLHRGHKFHFCKDAQAWIEKDHSSVANSA